MGNRVGTANTDEYSRSGSLEVGKTARQTLLVGCSTVDGALDEAVVRDDG